MWKGGTLELIIAIIFVVIGNLITLYGYYLKAQEQAQKEKERQRKVQERRQKEQQKQDRQSNRPRKKRYKIQHTIYLNHLKEKRYG